MAHKLKIMTCFFLLSRLSFAYGMKKSSQDIDDECNQISDLLTRPEMSIIDACTCEQILLEEEILSKEESIMRAIDHNCTFCLNFNFSNKNWDINHKLLAHSNCWKTPLLFACQKGSLKAAKIICNFKPEFTLNFSCKTKWSAIHFAAFSDNDTHDIIEILLDHKVNINEQTKGGVEFRSLTQFNHIKKKFDFSCKPGTTALFIACFLGNIPRITQLLKRGASIMHCLDDGENIFHSFGNFLHAYSSEKIIDHDERLKIKLLLNLLKDACDEICYTYEHLKILCSKDKKYRDTLFLVLLIKNRPKSLLKLLPKLLLIQVFFKFIKTTSTILLAMPGSTDDKTALQRISEKLDLD